MKKSTQNRQQTPKEEKWSAGIHIFGVILASIGFYFLIFKKFHSFNALQLTSLIVFNSTLILMFLSSTVYHLLPQGVLKVKFRIVDHIAIFLLIAGTYTPYTLIVLWHNYGMIIFSLVWILAITGIIFKFFITGKYKRLSTWFYIGLGWIVIFAIHPLVVSLEPIELLLLVAGGVFYTAGTIFYRWTNLTYNHTIWHIFVLLGGISHYISIFLATNQ